MNLEKLRRLQEELASRVTLEDKYSVDEIEYVIGVDQAFVGNKVISAAVKFSFPELDEVEHVTTVEDTKFPYIPTFLMFREGEPAVNAVRKLLERRTVILVDGSGIAHPRRCGLATFVALSTGEPAVGITKKKLYGETRQVGSRTLLLDNGEVIGYVLKTCRRCNPIYVSPGSFITPETSLKVVEMCLRGYKLPEPIRAAHRLADLKKKSLKS